MGCFSYLCKECGKGIFSNSFRGEKVKLFFIRQGVVVETMEGEYNSYGSVFIDGTQVNGVKHPLRESMKWNSQEEINEAFSELEYTKYLSRREQQYEKLKDVLPEIASHYHSYIQTAPRPMRNDWGVCAVHSRCFTGVPPTTISDMDPNQG